MIELGENYDITLGQDMFEKLWVRSRLEWKEPLATIRTWWVLDINDLNAVIRSEAEL